MGSLGRELGRRHAKLLRQFDVAREHVFRNFLRGTPPPSVLSHITGSVSNVESIVRSRAIWATRSLLVRGDANELAIGEEVASAVINRLLETETRSFARAAMSEVLADYSHERISAKAKVFIACFTPSIEPVHWQVYGNSGRGCAITFNMRQHVRPPDVGLDVTLLRVLYDAKEVEVHLQKAVAQALAAAARLPPELQARTTGKLRSLMLRLAAVTAIQTKHPRFAGEVEWRVVASPEEGAENRIELEPVEHVAVELNPGSPPDIREIRIGPNCPNAEDELVKMRRFLEKHGCRGTPVRVG